MYVKFRKVRQWHKQSAKKHSEKLIISQNTTKCHTSIKAGNNMKTFGINGQLIFALLSKNMLLLICSCYS